MTLVLEDGSGVAGADTYATLDEFKAYWDLHGETTAVKEADDCKMEIALRIATQYLELSCGPVFIGFKRTKAQGLHFPVNSGVRNDGFTLDTTEIPQEVKDAEFELAERSLAGTNLFDPDQVGGVGSIQSTTKKVGPIEKKTEFTEAGQDIETNFPKVNQILGQIIHDFSGFSPVIRS